MLGESEALGDRVAIESGLYAENKRADSVSKFGWMDRNVEHL